MKVITATFVFSDWEYLSESLSSIQDFGWRHYIIEGSWQSAIKSSRVSERSNQLTYDIINKFVDNSQTLLVQANEPLERDQRQVAMEFAKKEQADWLFMLDADEVYTKSSLLKIHKMLQNCSNMVNGFRVNSYNFINSFKRWYNGNYMRIFRVTPQAKFYMDNDCAWPDKAGTTPTIPGYSFYHYNYVRRNVERFWTMMRYQNYQDPTFDTRILPQYGYNDEKKEYKIPDDIPIYDFTGKHPAIMKNHPYIVNDIFGDGQLSFLEE
jgi:hypothetical protein